MAGTDDNSLLNRFYADFSSEIRERLSGSEEEISTEQAFTRYVLYLLAEAGEIEDAQECWDERLDRIGRRIHRINGYSLSENLETLQLFHVIYRGGDEVSRIYKSDIEAGIKQSFRFLKTALSGYFKDMEETAPAFDFARELHKNRKEIVRAQIFILTDGECTAGKPDEQLVEGILLSFRIIDLRYLMRLEGGESEPVEINFEEYAGGCIPCLSMPSDNSSYLSYLAIVPGSTLADIYGKYGSRLLEMNVRAFLQFNGKVNKGIRETILREPHMFLAFNNGIAATAEEVRLVELPGGGKAISYVREFQVVNGGQTTAGIFHTRKKDRADISQVFVQMKLSVLQSGENRSEIVNRISRYANSQNKVSDADLTANAPFHIEIEKLSRSVWAPPGPGRNNQTRWFYERARGQYKNALGKEATKKKKEAFLLHSPRNQMFVKEELAKYFNVFDQLPWHVVRGNQKNYAIFMGLLAKQNLKPDTSFFMDVVAKAILFREAEKIYGVKPNSIGDMRYITVPYTLAWLSYRLQTGLDYYRIWKRQAVDEELKTSLRGIMIRMEEFIREKAPGSLYGEWAKKEECWLEVRQQDFGAVTESGSSALKFESHLSLQPSNISFSHQGNNR